MLLSGEMRGGIVIDGTHCDAKGERLEAVLEITRMAWATMGAPQLCVARKALTA